MKTRTILSMIGVIVLIYGFSGSAPAVEQGKVMKRVQLPMVVLHKFQHDYPNANMQDVNTETKDGVKYFEIVCLDDKVVRGIMYTEDAKVVQIRESIPIDDIPENVTETLKAKFPDSNPVSAQKMTRGETKQFAVVLNNQDKNTQVVVDSSGKIISEKMVPSESVKEGTKEIDQD